MTYQAEILVDPNRRHGRIHPWVYGQFIEHIGRVIYGGIFEPGSPLADEDGYRTDVLEAAKDLGPTLLRWPGGNFASGYHWRDGIGPRSERPVRRDLAWNAIEQNGFGTEEFLAYCRLLGAVPYLNLNMGTGSLDEALQWLEYCNGVEEGIPEVELRRAGPHPAPHDVTVWGLGNEVYGWWQHGHTTAAAYGEAAREWGRLLRWTDPRAKIIGVGAPDPDWNWTVLRTAARSLDYLSLHFYWAGRGEDPYHEVVSGPVGAEQDIVSAYGMCLAARKSLGITRRPITIAVDEWGVWYRSFPVGEVDPVTLAEEGFSARSGLDVRFEEPYDLKDALAVAGWLHVLWRNPEKVTLATQAQMVNAIAPIRTTPEAVIRHTIYWPMAHAATQAGDESLDLQVLTEAEVPAPKVWDGSLPALDAGGTIDRDSGRIFLSIANRSRDEACELTLRTPSSGSATVSTLWDEDPFAGNTVEEPHRITPVERTVECTGELSLALEPHSYTTVTLPGATR